MADSSTQSENCKRPLIPSFFGFKTIFSETDDQTHLSTPTSILDKSHVPFCLNQLPKSPKLKPKNEGIGLALIKSSDPDHKNEMVLFGAKLRIKIPTQTESQTESPTHQPGSKISTEGLSVSEMELSEDYTCIISHGPDPKTTHIFDNCIVETYLCLSDNHHRHNTKDNINQKKNFLSYCHTCIKNLEQSNDIYIYRGEKAFCSQECRYQEMVLDETDQN
jgi:hypothetical protein